jgi:hypothetical protein
VFQNNSPSSKLKFKILAPSAGEVPDAFSRINGCRAEHDRLLSKVQRLRGDVYREYGPVAAQLTSDGRHEQGIDPASWHIVLEDACGDVVGCSRYREIKQGFRQLGASHSPIAPTQRYGQLLRLELENQISSARRRNVQYGEAGAWALRPEIRCSTAAINSVLMTFALAEQLGGGLGVTTATTRHHSAAILKRLGGRRLDGLPAYYDPAYGCHIEIIQFDSATLGPQYAARVERMRAELLDVEVVCPNSRSDFSVHGFPLQHLHLPPAAASYMVQ